MEKIGGGVKGPGRGFLLICFAIVCIFLIGTAGAGNEVGGIMDASADRENEIREEDDKVRDEAYELANDMRDERRQEKADAEELANNIEKILREMKMERNKLNDDHKNIHKRKRRGGRGLRRPRFLYHGQPTWRTRGTSTTTTTTTTTTPPPPTTTTMDPVKAKGYITRLIKCVKKRRPMTLDEEVGKELECILDDNTIEDIIKLVVNKYGSNDKAFAALAKMADMPDERDPWRV